MEPSSGVDLLYARSLERLSALPIVKEVPSIEVTSSSKSAFFALVGDGGQLPARG